MRIGRCRIDHFSSLTGDAPKIANRVIPLSAEEAIPWHGKRLYIGTGLYGGLPVMPEVYTAAEQRHIEVVALPTPELCAKLKALRPNDINAVLHVTC